MQEAGLSWLCREEYGDEKEERRRLAIAPLTAAAILPGWEATSLHMVAAQLRRCTSAAAIHFQQDTSVGSERQLQIRRALKFLRPLVPPTTTTHTPTRTLSHLNAVKSLNHCHDSLSKSTPTPVLPIWYQMFPPEMRNPRHDNVPEGYCFPPAHLLQRITMRSVLLTMPPDLSCSCYRMARRRS